MNTKHPGLTAEVYELLNTHGHLFEGKKQTWQAFEMAIVYQITNAYWGKQDQDTGCGSCRNSHVQQARKIYQEYKATL